MVRSILLSAIFVLASACSSINTLEPYDQDVAFYRRAAAPPRTTANSIIFITSSSYTAEGPLSANHGDEFFRECMVGRFQARFPRVALPPALR